MNILLVEDQPVNQEVAMAMLEEMGHNVTIANNGNEAVEIILTQVFDMIFMDCQMPVMDGYSATTILKEMMKKGKIFTCPVIAVTAHAMASDREKCMAAGMDDYLSKPLEEKSLIDIINKWSGGNALAPRGEIVDQRIMEKLRELMGEKFPKLIETYIANSEKIKYDLIEVAKESDKQKLGKVAHGLKGSAQQIGATNLAQKLGELEYDPSLDSILAVSDISILINKVNQELEELIK